MLQRCRRTKNINFERYGGRGINVCRRWESFANFLTDMEPSFRPGLTLERINNKRGYSKANCRWATYAEQMRNYRNNVVLDTPWGSMIMKDAAARAGIPWLALRARIHAGWHPSHWFKPTQQGGDRKSPQALTRQKERRIA